MSKNRAIRSFIVCLLLGGGLLFSSEVRAASEVAVQGEAGKWELYVNGKPFELKGVGCHPLYGTHGEDYMAMAEEMGANALRTWNYTPGGIDKAYMDRAEELGLMVASWMWLNPTTAENPYISYKPGSPYRRIIKEKIRRWVLELKDHDALLMWGVGNEVIFFSHSEEEKIAFAQFLNEICQLIHELDPDHPVIYASAFEKGLPYLAKYTPELDIVGINMYCQLISMHRRWEMAGFDKPYILTEFGPVNKWGVSADANGYPMDPPDWHKAKQYEGLFRGLEKYQGYCLGGFVFFLGELGQWTDSWWTLNWQDLKRASYWVAYENYTGKEPCNLAPRINTVELSKVKGLKPFEEIEVKIDAEDPEGDPLTFDYDVRLIRDDIQLRQIEEYWEEVMSPVDGGFKLSMPSFEADFILYILVKDDHGNVAVANKSLAVGEKKKNNKE